LDFHTDALLFRLLVALLPKWDLLIFAKDLFVAARTTWSFQQACRGARNPNGRSAAAVSLIKQLAQGCRRRMRAVSPLLRTKQVGEIWQGEDAD
jgi:hypothetical protein